MKVGRREACPPGWEAGGFKFVYTRDLVVRGNYSHNNDGPGLWTDVNNIFSLYEDNLVEDNSFARIFHEVSYDAIIRNNVVRRNGRRNGYWLGGAEKSRAALLVVRGLESGRWLVLLPQRCKRDLQFHSRKATIAFRPDGL